VGYTVKRLCTICARGGSKGVPGKNLRVVAGRPLIAHTVAHALDSGIFDAVAVGSDSPEILEAGSAAGATHVVLRPAELASDHADKSPAIVHCGSEVERITGIAFDTFVDLDATAPLRSPRHVREAAALLEDSGAGNVYSVCPSRRSPYFNLVEVGADGVPRLCKPTDPPIVRRQDAPATYDMNASIYAWRRDAFFGAGAPVHMEGTRLYIMPEYTLFDIDGEFDIELVEYVLRRRFMVEA